MERIIIGHKKKDGTVTTVVCLEGFEPEIFWEDTLKFYDLNKKASALTRLPRIVGFFGLCPKTEEETEYQKDFENLTAAIDYFRKIIKGRNLLWFNGWMYLFDEEQDCWLVAELGLSDSTFETIDNRLKGLNRYSVTITESIDKTIWMYAKNVVEANERVVNIYEQGGLNDREGVVREARIEGFKMDEYNNYDGELRYGSLLY